MILVLNLTFFLCFTVIGPVVDDDDNESTATCDIWVEVSEEEPDESEADDSDLWVDISDSENNQPAAEG